MATKNKLQIGDVSDNGQITIIDEDRLCYLVKSVSKGAVGLRTISKALLDEFVVYMRQHPEVPANEVRFKISGQSDIDKYEYGYGATLSAMANMVLGRMKVNHRTAIVSKSATANLRICSLYRPYITAIKSKPFLLLAGISGTGKSRIVRELARACWEEGSVEYETQKPKNFEMVQVKPNWHDSSELIGYVSRVSGSPVFVAGDFLKFVAKAWENPEVPYFLCLDEMNLAPVEQYFAEYLSVVESRKADDNGVITTDPILKKCKEQWYFDLTAQLTRDDEVRARFNKDGIAIPQNLIVVGTVNMDETTFSFSRKVLDRAMTIEMNEVDLYGGLDDRHEKIGKLEAGNLIGTAVEGVDVYRENKEVCDTALKYLQAINLNLDGTPFKVAYRTRNEFLLYVVNNLPYNKDKDGKEIPQQEVIARALDEITSMKILSRIEGDSDKIGNLLEELGKTVSEQLNVISGKEYSEKKNDGEKVYSVSLAKLKEMEGRLKSGYTSFWS
ncbi:MAG: AAA family ATPase [Prevotella sp.]|nr:AAA family ATPase [Prevotella sp.]